ncbi:MAG: hypothetical protein IJA86_08470 [Clostridia bacterium]|nr:hypothetical protein [Clostridia bacterium]
MTLLFLLVLSAIAKLKERKKKKNRILNSRYLELRKRVYAIMDGEDMTTNVPKFAKEIRKLYIGKQITAVHYHDLMKYLSAHYYVERFIVHR